MRVVAREKDYMKFHTSSGEDYYERMNRANEKDKIQIVYGVINNFNWENLNIKDERVKKQLAIEILDKLDSP